MIETLVMEVRDFVILRGQRSQNDRVTLRALG
jgi:hypothetical protein